MGTHRPIPSRPPVRELLGASLIAALALCAGLGRTATASAYATDQSTTQLVSRALGGGLPDAPSGDPVISRDNRIGSLLAYDSAATNIVAQPTGGHRNIYVVTRQGPYESGPHPVGTVWQYGSTALASVGIDGQPANGDSWAPSLGGDSRHPPRCVAFLSAASNLVAGDTGGFTDAFVRYLPNGPTVRVSVNAAGEPANGSTSEVVVDGACSRVAFVSDATNLALTRTHDPRWRDALTTAAPAGVREVYVRQIGRGSHRGFDRGLVGLTFLASATHGRPGHGSSGQIALSRDGQALAFESTAGNLGGSPAASPGGGAIPQVYERMLTRAHLHRHHAAALWVLHVATRLISATRQGHAANGPSGVPSIGQAGDDVAFETTASDLLEGCSNGRVQIVLRALILEATPKMFCASRSRSGGLGAGDSLRPSVTDGGADVYFDTDAPNLQPIGRQGSFAYSGARDVISWDRPRNDIRLINSLAWNNAPSTLPAAVGQASSRGNYLPFTSTDADLDPINAGIASILLQSPVGCGGLGEPGCAQARHAGVSVLSLPSVTIPIPGVGRVTLTGVTIYDKNQPTPVLVATSAPTRTISLTPLQATPIELMLGAVFPVPSTQQVYLRYVGPNAASAAGG